jgi:hypothetical protein
VGRVLLGEAVLLAEGAAAKRKAKVKS